MQESSRFLQAGLLAVAVSVAAGPGYLATVGPPALRFERAPAPPSGTALAFPPASAEPRSSSPDEKPSPLVAPQASVETTNAAPALSPLEPSLLGISPESSPGDLSTRVSPETGFPGPQLWLKYFIGPPGTNSTGAVILSPVGFVPPLPFIPPSSSATFQTTPPGKP
jgi:hypothetical protein